MNRNSKKRRATMVATIGGSLLLGIPRSWATTLPPPPPLTLEDHVRDAHLIVVGVIERFVFRGWSPAILKNEYNKEFIRDNGVGNRALDVFVSVTETLKYNLPIQTPKVLRFQQPIPNENHLNAKKTSKIFLAKRWTLIHADDPSSFLFFPVIDALPMTDLQAVREIILSGNKPVTKN